MYQGLSTAYWLTLHGLVTFVAVLIYVITAHVLQQRRHPTAAIAWVLFIMLVPYVALPGFLMFGSRKHARPPRREPSPPSTDEPSWAVQTALALRQAPPAEYRELQVHADGREALQALWDTMDGATRSLDVCTFILGRDAIGRATVARLIGKARAGVQVRLLLDGLGSLMGGRPPDLQPLRAAGAQVALFVPPLHSPLKGRSNLRDHRKLVIADAGLDSARLWCGGRNLAAAYFEGDGSAAPWHDLSFDLRGPFVEQTHALFVQDWHFTGGVRLPALPPGTEPAVALAAAVASAPAADEALADDASAVDASAVDASAFHASALNASAFDTAAGDAPASDASLSTDTRPAPLLASDAGQTLLERSMVEQPRAQLIASGPDQVDDTVYSLLVTAAYRAHERILLVTPYFVPDSALLLALSLAARRGVVVELLLPARSNHRLSDVARNRSLRALAAAGAQIWLAPRMLHAKLAIIDHTVALAGSANLDSRSLFINYELMVAFHDLAAIERFGAWYAQERTTAREHHPRRAGLLRDIGEGLLLWAGFQL